MSIGMSKDQKERRSSGREHNPEYAQTVDPSKDFRQFAESFLLWARSPHRRPQAAKSPYGAFFLPSFFFAPASSKKKRIEILRTLTVIVPFVDNQSIIRSMLLTLSIVVPEGGYKLAELFFKHFFNYGGVGLVVKGDTF